jgi:hypothetical protein
LSTPGSAASRPAIRAGGSGRRPATNSAETVS